MLWNLFLVHPAFVDLGLSTELSYSVLVWRLYWPQGNSDRVAFSYDQFSDLSESY